MALSAYLKKSEVPKLCELYEFASGGGAWLYVASNSDVIYSGKTYQAAAIRRGPISNGGSGALTARKVRIDAHLKIDPGHLQLDVSPLPETTVRIIRCLASNTSTYEIVFSGRAEKFSISANIAQFSCIESNILTVVLPRIIRQSYCNWRVFDDDCGLIESEWQKIMVVSSVSSDRMRIYSTGFSSYATGYFTQGYIRYGLDTRFVTGHTSNYVDLQIPFGPELAAGATIYAVPGCSGASDICKSKFNNWSKFMGMPTIPSNNPVIWGML